MCYRCQVAAMYVKVKEKWYYLYRVIDKVADTIDSYLSRTRNTKTTKWFQGKTLKILQS